MHKPLITRTLAANQYLLWSNFAFSCFIHLLILSTSIYSLQVLDRVLTSGSVYTLLMLSLIMLIIYLALSPMQWVRSVIFLRLSNRLNQLTRSLFEYGLQHKPRNTPSYLRDLLQLRNFTTGANIVQMFDAPWSIIYFAVIFVLNPVSGWITLASAIVLLLLALLNEWLTKKDLQQANLLNSASLNQSQQFSNNSEAIVTMGMAAGVADRWLEQHNTASTALAKATHISSVISSISKTIRLLVQMLTMAVTAYLVIDNQLTAGVIIATSILVGKALAPFDAAIGIYKSWLVVTGAYGRLKKIDVEPSTLMSQLPPLVGKLVVKELYYKPHANLQNNILANINFTLQAGGSLGIIGANASGKTSLVRLLTGFVAANYGHISIDNISFSQMNEDFKRHNIGYLPQEVDLAPGSVLDNISRFDSDTEPAQLEKQVIAAANFVGCHDLLLRLPQGYNTQVENAFLSLGQKQHIGLARAFYNLPKFVVLDEANAHLDAQGEQALLATLSKARAAKITLIVVSHKPSLLEKLDNILLLHKSKVAAFDTAHNILKQYVNAK